MTPHDLGLLVMGAGAGICFAQGYNAVRTRRRTARIAKAVTRYAMAERIREAYLANGHAVSLFRPVVAPTPRPVRTTPCHFPGCNGHHGPDPFAAGVR